MMANPPDLKPLKLGLCGLSPQCYVNSLLKPPYEQHTYPQLKTSQFCCSGRHCFGKDPRVLLTCCEPINPSFSGICICCICWLNIRQDTKPSFQVMSLSLCLLPRTTLKPRHHPKQTVDMVCEATFTARPRLADTVEGIRSQLWGKGESLISGS